jgi:hypothetical protein
MFDGLKLDATCQKAEDITIGKENGYLLIFQKR